MKTKKITTKTPEGALKRMNFEPGRTITGSEKRAKVLANLPKRKWNKGEPPKYPTIVMRDGVPHRIKDGVWVPLVSKGVRLA